MNLEDSDENGYIDEFQEQEEVQEQEVEETDDELDPYLEQLRNTVDSIGEEEDEEVELQEEDDDDFYDMMENLVPEYSERVVSPSKSGMHQKIELAKQLMMEKFPHLRATSGIRSQKENQAVGGVKNSKHLIGEAQDLSYDPEAYDYYNNVLAPKLGLDRAPQANHGTGKHIHMETLQYGGYAQRGVSNLNNRTNLDYDPFAIQSSLIEAPKVANYALNPIQDSYTSMTGAHQEVADDVASGAGGGVAGTIMQEAEALDSKGANLINFIGNVKNKYNDYKGMIGSGASQGIGYLSSITNMMNDQEKMNKEYERINAERRSSYSSLPNFQNRQKTLLS